MKAIGSNNLTANHLLLKELGSYSSGFFKMTVPIDGPIDLESMSPLDFSVFFHEYIHFIQDFTTSVGCRRIYVISEYIRQCVARITAGDKEFIVPMEATSDDKVEANIRLLSHIENYEHESISVVSIANIELLSDPVIDKEGNTIPMTSVAVKTRSDEIFCLGGFVLRESMAYLLEQLCCTEYNPSPDFPYNIARLVSDYVLGERSLSDLELLALCDTALLASNPGLYFYDLLCRIDNNELSFDSPEAFYRYFYGLRFVSMDNSITHALADFVSLSQLASESLNSYYSLRYLNDLTQWIDKVFSLGRRIRNEGSFFYLEMATGKKDQRNRALQYIARRVGSPLITNQQGLFFQVPVNGDTISINHLLVIEQIYRLFHSGDVPCLLKPNCDNSPGTPPSPTDNRCITAPWLRCRDTVLCPYALFWHHRGLSGFSPIQSH